MAGLFGDLRGGGGSIGLFGRTRGTSEEEQRRLAELAMLADELGDGPQSQDLPGIPPREPLGEREVTPAQLSLLPGDAPSGASGLPFEPPSNGSPFPPGLAGDPRVLGLPGAAGGSLEGLPTGGLRAEAEGYADQIAQRGTREWGSAVRNFVMQGPVSPEELGFHPDEDPASGGFESAAEGERFASGSSGMQSGKFGQAEAEAESLRPAAFFWEGEDSPTQFVRPVAFQHSFDRAQERAIARKRAEEQARTTRGNAGAKPQQRVSPVPVRATQARPGSEPKQQAPEPYRLGRLAEKRESNGAGPGTWSSGRGDRGGVSYGVYQLASRTGDVEAFLKGEGRRWASELVGLDLEGAEFKRRWQAIAKRDPQRFRDAQHEYIKTKKYNPVVRKVTEDTGLNLEGRHNAVREAVWSAATQHGQAGKVLTRAVKEADRLAGRQSADYDAVLIKQIYAARSRHVAGLKARNDAERRNYNNIIRYRYPAEEQDAIRMLKE